MRAAARWRIPPLHLILGRGDPNTFTPQDRLLLVALEHLEQTIDPATGMSTLFTTHGDYDGGLFQMNRLPDDLARAVIDRWQAAQEKAQKAPKPGERWGVTFVGVVEGENVRRAKQPD